MEFNEIEKASLLRLILATKMSGVPALARSAAVRLYHLGKRRYALDFLIKQMNLYKLPETHRNIISETCHEAAKALGSLGDDRAIEPLLDALRGLGFGPAIALARLGGPAIENRVAEMINTDVRSAVFAAVCLGYMKNKEIVPRLINLLEHKEKYEDAIADRVSRLSTELLRILGAYTDCTLAEDYFKTHLTEADIDWILYEYLHQETYPSQRWVEWDIVNKYGWNVYLMTEREKFAFRHTNLGRWKNFSDCPSPFATEADVVYLRKEILSSILRSMAIKES